MLPLLSSGTPSSTSSGRISPSTRFSRLRHVCVSPASFFQNLDVEKCLNFDGEFVGCSDVVSDEPVFVRLNFDNEVVSFSRENGDFEWVGPACLERHKIKFVSNNVFNQFENFLPVPMLKTDARDVDTYDDYLRAKLFVKSWSNE